MLFLNKDKAKWYSNKEIDKALKEGRAVDNRWHICKDESYLCLWFSFSITWYRWRNVRLCKDTT
jgi:hypothetical protein